VSPIVLGGPPLPAPLPPQNIAGHAPTYTYLCCDLVTNLPLALIPFTGVSFDLVLNGAGTWKATLPLFDPRIQALNWDEATVPARCVVYVFRNDTVLWAGIVWTRDYDSTKQVESFQASTCESYYMHVPAGGTHNFVNVDQLDIVRTLIADVNASGGTLPMTVSTNESGIFRTFDSFGYDFKWLSDQIKVLQELPNGFDFGADVSYTPGSPPHVQFNLDFPRRGVTAAAVTAVFEYPGNVESYKLSEDGTAFADGVYELGAGSGPAMAVGSAADTSLLADGWPVMIAIVSRKDIVDPAFLTEYAQGDLAIYGEPAQVTQVVVRADRDPVLGSYKTGDDVRLRINDARFPAPGLDQILRVQKIAVAVADDGTETVTLDLITTEV
jgi:hypothetical protein